jgi:cell wall-associated NlpC family hydrolase
VPRRPAAPGILARVRPAKIVLVSLLCAASAGCAEQAGSGQSSSASSATAPPPAAHTATTPTLHSHPQAIEPVAGASARVTPPPSGDIAGVSVGPVSNSLPAPVTETQIRQQLAASGMTASPNQATLTPAGLAVAPIDAPAVVQKVIAAGNEIARLPYRYGGGHLTYEDTAYDCSGSISYVFAAAGLLNHTVVSGQLENWGDPGPGKWITVYANAGHTFMIVAGLRFDTVALAETGSRWSNRPPDEPDLNTFAVRHPPGL